MPRQFLKRWLGLARTRFFVAVTVPAVVGGAVAETQGAFSVGAFLLIIAGLVFVESSNLLFGDWTAFRGKSFLPRSNPPPILEGSPMVSERVLPSGYTLHASVVCFVSAAVVLAYFALVRGWPILLLGFLAVLISFFYLLSPVKYGFFSTALLPPLLTISVDFVFTGRFVLAAFLSGLPLLFSSTGVIYTYRVLYAHPASASGFSARLKLLVLLYCFVFLSVILLDVTGLIPSTTGLALLALPILFYLINRSKEERVDYVPVTSLGVLLHTVTGLLVALGLVLS